MKNCEEGQLGSIEVYKDALSEFEKTIKHAIHVSENLGDILVNNHTNFAHRLFSKLILNSSGIIRLCPYNNILPITHVFWDFQSIATLMRSLLENYAAFHYFANEKCTEEEFEFRFRLAIYHWQSELYAYYRHINADHQTLDEFDKGLPQMFAELSKLPFYKKIEKKSAKKIEKGQVYMLKSYFKILESIDFKDAKIAQQYRFYSNYTHSTAMAVMKMDNIRGRGLQNDAEVGHITIALWIAKILLIRITKEILDAIPEGKPKISKSVFEYFEKEYLKL